MPVSHLVHRDPARSDLAPFGSAIAETILPAGTRSVHSQQPGTALVCVMREDQCLIAASRALPVTRLGRSGVILGDIFRGREAHPVTDLSQPEIARILASEGRDLLDHWHGDYLTILHSAAGCQVLRPPFGSLPCLFHDDGTHLIVASDIDTLRAALGTTFRLDYDAIACHLIAGDLRTSRTCLSGIRELRGGDRLTWTRGRLGRETLWSPAAWTAPVRGAPCGSWTPQEFQDHLVTAVARATCHLERPLLMLSGGLDSSLIACALAAQDRPFLALNFVAAHAAGDERHYARQVAAASHCELVEQAMVWDQTMPVGPSGFRLARPAARLFEQNLHARAWAVARETGCDGIVDGGGGDNMFCSLQSAAPAADCLLARGGWEHFWSTCRTIGHLAQVSDLAVARQAVARAWQRSRGPRWKPDLRFLSADAAALTAEAIRHPWLALHGQRPGRAAHIALLAAAQGYAEDGPHGAKGQSVAPLLSQQLAEYCLAIPSWDWFDEEHNRVATRHALADMLPPDVLWRRGKGAPDSYVAALFEAERPRLRAHLADGLLASAGVIDRHALLLALADPRPVRGHDYSRILRLADAETWARDINAR